MLQRIQILVDRETKKDLEVVSKSTGSSMSKIARSVLKRELAKEKKIARKKKNGAEALLRWARGAVKGPGDSEYDKYAYDL